MVEGTSQPATRRERHTYRDLSFDARPFGLRHCVKADLMDSLLRCLARVDRSGTRSVRIVARNLRGVLESIASRYFRRAVRRYRAADCQHAGTLIGCHTARTTAAIDGAPVCAPSAVFRVRARRDLGRVVCARHEVLCRALECRLNLRSEEHESCVIPGDCATRH